MNKNRRRRERKQSSKDHPNIPVVQLEPKYSAIVDAVADRDREFFQQHPGQNAYMRKYVPGEFADLHRLGQDDVVLVTQIQPGMRQKVPGGQLPGEFLYLRNEGGNIVTELGEVYLEGAKILNWGIALNSGWGLTV